MNTKYYGEDGQERLDTEPEGVVESVFDDPETIENYDYPFIVHVFTPRKVSIDAKFVLERVLENLDEEYGDQDGDYTKPTDKMLKAAEEFVNTIKGEYTSFMCEQTGEKIEYSQKDILDIVGRE